MRSIRCLGAILVVLAASLTSTASAQTTDDRKAAGNQKMVDSDFAGAIEDYEAALAVAPNDLALYYNLGRANGLLGRYPESLAAFEAFAARATPDLKAKISGFDALLEDTRHRVAFLTVKCDVRGARVLLDQKILGPAPLARRAVNAGEVNVRIEAEGYLDDARVLTLPGAGEQAIQCHLLPKSTAGTLVVTAAPAGARISVDGTFRGNDRVDLPLSAGSHAVVAALDGYDETSTTFLVTAGSTRTLDLTLHPKAVPITSRWWFWGGVAVVVAGGVTVGIAALSEKPAGQGTIAPRQLGTP